MFGSAYHPQSQGLVEVMHKPLLEVLQAFCDEYPNDWDIRLPLARWAWNTTPKASLGGLTPYQVVTGLVPRSPLASFMKLSNQEKVTAQEYVAELMKSLAKTNELVARAQERRAEESRKRGLSGRIPRELEVGETVLLRRPPKHLRVDGEDVAVSAKLQAKARPEVYRIVKRLGDSNYVLGDAATGQEVTAFKQPVHADRLVPIECPELTSPIDELCTIYLEGDRGEIKAQAIDGRVLVEFASAEAESDFAHDYRRLGVRSNPSGRGVWIDLEKFDYSFEPPV